MDGSKEVFAHLQRNDELNPSRIPLLAAGWKDLLSRDTQWLQLRGASIGLQSPALSNLARQEYFP